MIPDETVWVIYTIATMIAAALVGVGVLVGKLI